MFKRRLLFNLVLLLCLAGLLFFLLRPSPPPAARGVVIAPDIRPAAVRLIRIERPQRPDLVFVEQDGVWHLQRPLRAAANPLLLRALLSLPAARSDRAYPLHGLDLARYGLKPPRAVILYDGRAIALGALNRLDQRRYALYGNKLYLIPDLLSDLPQSDAIAWLSHALLPPGARIVAIQAPRIMLHRGADGQWSARGRNGPLAPAALDAWLHAWQQAQALRVTAASAAPARHQGEIRIELTGGETLIYRIAATRPFLVLENPALDVAYWLPPQTAAKLLAPSAAPRHQNP